MANKDEEKSEKVIQVAVNHIMEMLIKYQPDEALRIACEVLAGACVNFPPASKRLRTAAHAFEVIVHSIDAVEAEERKRHRAQAEQNKKPLIIQ